MGKWANDKNLTAQVLPKYRLSREIGGNQGLRRRFSTKESSMRFVRRAFLLWVCQTGRMMFTREKSNRRLRKA